ncbi:MAG TPA: 30S ribosomal protein S11 [Candidatus Paceibacterota bacterium]|nr:30S ribosomal protein S11 [Candidatus Paceibacterota bacterium]
MGKKRIIKKGEEAPAPEAKQIGPQSSSKKVREGRVYVYSSYNNIIMTLTDRTGRVLAQVSAGAIGFKGTKKSTPFAASKVADALTQIAKNKGVEELEVFLKGVGAGRDSALRALGAKGFAILSIEDTTPVPHNGPRAAKVRRV